MQNPTSSPLNHQHIVACLWDFDKTLSPGYMQTPIFKHFGINERQFWTEVNDLAPFYAKQGIRMLSEIAYLNHFLTYVRHGQMRGLNNVLLKKLGAEVVLCPGLPTAFQKLKDHVSKTYAAQNIRLEHYILSTGLKPMILGSGMAPYVDGVYGSEFIEEAAGPNFNRQTSLPIATEANEITQIACPLDNTSKTRCIFEINKGCNKNPSIDVNSFVEQADRRIPVENMIYIADGPSDVPAFSVMRQFGGLSVAVYNPTDEKEFAQTDALLQNHRVNFVGGCDYRDESPTYRWLKMHLSKICDRIAATSDQSVKDRIGSAPKHLSGSNTVKPWATQTELL